ncbi:HamA C-terminal domain-containing protein [Dermabacteraceae bacterium P13101]
MISEATQTAVDQQVPLIEVVQRLVRGGWDEVESSIVTYGEPIALEGTRSIVRCHFLRSDPLGAPRLKTLAQQLANQIVNYCIPRTEVEKLGQLSPDRQIPEITRLANEAAGLFTQTQVRTGEGAELLLYALLEKGLQIPQILSKMSLKTSTEMQYHGADGVHAKLLDNGDLAVYWGEAKLYESVSKAMTDCMDSLAPYLAGTAHEQDVFLIRHYVDAGNMEVTARLLEYFDDKSILSANVEMRGACLIGFTHDNYPNLPREEASIRAELDETLGTWAESTRKRLENRSLTKYSVEVFFFPMPSVEEFRKAIKAELRIEVKS